jgi:hypothetical protein
MIGMPISGFTITFTMNGSFTGANMFVTGEMMFADVVSNLYKNFPLMQQYQPKFYLNFQEIKADSCKKLSELGITNYSNVEIKTAMNNQMQQGMVMQQGTGMQPGTGNQTGMGAPGNNGGEEYLNIVFTLAGKFILIQATRNSKFSELTEKLSNKLDVKDKAPTFLLNSRRIEMNDPRTVGQLNLQNNSKIEVVLTADVIGAYF